LRATVWYLLPSSGSNNRPRSVWCQFDVDGVSIDLKAIRFQRGTATVVSSEGANPQPLAAMKNGVWTVTVDFGNGPEPANATFSAGPETTSRF
jgi:hypothetical protein